jgi:hypothetical protein
MRHPPCLVISPVGEISLHNFSERLSREILQTWSFNGLLLHFLGFCKFSRQKARAGVIPVAMPSLSTSRLDDQLSESQCLIESILVSLKSACCQHSQRRNGMRAGCCTLLDSCRNMRTENSKTTLRQSNLQDQ